MQHLWMKPQPSLSSRIDPERHNGLSVVQDEYTDIVERVLDTLSLVDAPVEEDFDKLTRLAARFISVPVALLSFVEEDRDRQYFKSQIGLSGHWADSRQTPLSHSFCQYVKRDNKPFVVENAPRDPRVWNNLAIRDLDVQAYLGAPVHGPDGAPLGALCVIESKPRDWQQDDIDAMVDLAGCVTDQIRLRAALRRSYQL